MITRKCNADNALNRTDCVAVASQAAKVPMHRPYSHLTKCFYLLTYVIVPSRQQLTGLTKVIGLVPACQDITVASASQAYYEQIFSICGELTAGRGNQLIQISYT